jgi:hypothetical protein
MHRQVVRRSLPGPRGCNGLHRLAQGYPKGLCGLRFANPGLQLVGDTDSLLEFLDAAGGRQGETVQIIFVYRGTYGVNFLLFP